MKISFLKIKDSENYKMMKGLGFDVCEIEKPDDVDLKMKELRYFLLKYLREVKKVGERSVNYYNSVISGSLRKKCGWRNRSVGLKPRSASTKAF